MISRQWRWCWYEVQPCSVGRQHSGCRKLRIDINEATSWISEATSRGMNGRQSNKLTLATLLYAVRPIHLLTICSFLKQEIWLSWQLACRDFQYISNLWQVQSENTSDSDLEVYATYLDKLIEDFKVHIEDLEKMKVLEWILTQFDVERRNGDINLYLQEEFIDMTLDLEASAWFGRKILRKFYSNKSSFTNILSFVQCWSYFFVFSSTILWKKSLLKYV